MSVKSEDIAREAAAYISLLLAQCSDSLWPEDKATLKSALSIANKQAERAARK